MRSFSHFICGDWSGAQQERPKGIALAQIGSRGAPQLIKPRHRWSRQDVTEKLRALAQTKSDTLIGFDFSFALPFADHQHYFPQWSRSPNSAKELWALIDSLCDQDRFGGVQSLLAHREAKRHFRHGKDDIGDLFEGGLGRLRQVEYHQRVSGQANSASCFNLIGPAQVGKASLTGMRMLHALQGTIPIWPFDPVPDEGPLVIEIYTAMAARAAGVGKNKSKVRDREGLKRALDALNAPCPAHLPEYSDHVTDALITAAWMRSAAQNKALWQPKLMTKEIAEKEGWTFGVI